MALFSAVLYGIVDFVGGRISRDINGIALALYVQVFGLAAMLVLASVMPGTMSAEGFIWGIVSGVGSGIAIMFLYTGMGKGKISLVVPLAAVIGAGIPVLIGIAFLGERPSTAALLGIVLVLSSVWMVSRGGDSGCNQPMAGFSDCLIAGLGVAIQYAAVAHTSASAGIWPIVANRAASIVVVFAYGRFTGATLTIPRQYAFSALWIGVTASVSLALYLSATRLSMLTIAVVLASLYPVIPTMLAIWILKEKITGMQKLGLVCAAIAVAMIAAPAQ